MRSMSTIETMKENTAITDILSKGGASAVALCGYIAPKQREGFLTLSVSLRHLGTTIEVNEADISHVADLPESFAPFGAKIVWVRFDALVTMSVVRTANQIAARVPSIQSNPQPADDQPAPRAAEAILTEGRLRMRVAPTVMADSGPHCPCSTCHSDCSICTCLLP
jgi:hypothetical protein